LNCGMVDAVPRPDMMGDRPARDHHHAHDHLDVLGLAVATVAMLSEAVRAGPLKIGALPFLSARRVEKGLQATGHLTDLLD